MKRETALVKHQGDKTVIVVPKSKDGLELFESGLQRTGFTLTPRGASRKMKFISNDWPIRVSWESKHNSYVISATMFIPWGRIWAALTVLVMNPLIMCGYFYLPLISKTIFFACHVFAVIFWTTVVLMVFKKHKIYLRQKFDLSPRVKWQKASRQKWHRNLKMLIEYSFQVVFEEV